MNRFFLIKLNVCQFYVVECNRIIFVQYTFIWLHIIFNLNFFKLKDSIQIHHNFCFCNLLSVWMNYCWLACIDIKYYLWCWFGWIIVGLFFRHANNWKTASNKNILWKHVNSSKEYWNWKIHASTEISLIVMLEIGMECGCNNYYRSFNATDTWIENCDEYLLCT